MFLSYREYISISMPDSMRRVSPSLLTRMVPRRVGFGLLIGGAVACIVAASLVSIRFEQCGTTAGSPLNGPQVCSYGPHPLAVSLGGFLFIAGVLLSLGGLVIIGGHSPDHSVRLASLGTAIVVFTILLLLLLFYAMVATL